MNRYSLVLVVAWAATPFAVACSSFGIYAPESGAKVPVTAPVAVRVEWTPASAMQNLKVTWERLTPATTPTDITSQMVVTASDATTTLALPIGSYRLTAYGDVYDSVYRKQIAHSYPVEFEVVAGPTGGFSIQLQPAAGIIERTGSLAITVPVVRVAPFTGAVSIAVGGLPSGVTASPSSIPSGQASGGVSLAAAASAALGVKSASVSGNGPGVSVSSATLTLTVMRKSGAFVEASPAPYLASAVPATITSDSGTFRVVVASGASSVPQPRMATFFKGSLQLGGNIGFTLGPTSNLGGAGFCADAGAAALTHGVVLSGALPGSSSQNTFMVVDLTGNAAAIRAFPANMQSTQPTPHVFQPRILFSPDCTLALVAGANTLGPQANTLVVFDVNTGSPLGAEINFDSQSFSASLVQVANAQKVRVEVDIGLPTHQTAQLSVP